MIGNLVLEDGTKLQGESFGAQTGRAGEVVFSTGMAGYPEGITDPSFEGQILVLTYPLIGSYGVPDKKFWESDRIHISGLIVSDYIDTPSHFQSKQSLSQWLIAENIPGLIIPSTRSLTIRLREKGSLLGKIEFEETIPLHDPNQDNLVDLVSVKEVVKQGAGKKTIVLIDCGVKRNIERCLLARGVRLITVPWNFDPFLNLDETFDAMIVSNGPGDPKMASATITIIEKALKRRLPILGVCLGHQLLALAAGGDTTKLKFGHRSQNQPCTMESTKRCFITTQNHGFAVSKTPPGFEAWFTNANDGTNEGIRHKTLPVMSTQFHPEARPGPVDTEWVFDYFLKEALRI